ncbi:putative phage holin [Mycolicibacterium goodii]|uniref:putative phage holin n=1 Tax=Mycolicibacterium goodii TaxID=134601 RepID=UPI001BDC82AA|nr:hypothetical protein [Mycolicibacterium goodii]MBU8833582.1 hypothetical protein [Mycolicibacterium goodii]
MRWVYAAGLAAIAATFAADIWLPVDYRIAANTTIPVLAALVIVFATLYGLRSKWWSNRVGPIMLVKSVLLALVLVQISVSQWWDTDYPFRHQIRFTIYSLGAIAYIAMNVELWREQQHDRRTGDD